MKRLLGCVAVLLIALAVVGCSGKSAANASADASAPAATKLKIGISFQELDNEYFVVMKEAFEEACKELGAETVITDGRHDLNKQMNDIDDMLQQNIDILILNPTDSTGVRAAVDKAKRAGVVVVCVDAQADGPIDSFVGSKNEEAGYQSGKYLCEYLHGEGEVGILDGIPVVPILERVAGFRRAIKEYPGIKEVAFENGKQERDYALTVVENMIQAHPNLKGIFSVNDGGAMGALAAIEGSKKDIALVSVDGATDAVNAIKRGGAFKETTAQYPRDQIRIALGIALAKKWGAHVPAVVPVDVAPIGPKEAQTFKW